MTMKIKPAEITVRELTDGYKDDGENGVVGYGGMLDIRPPYQREFIYEEKQRDAVINTVMKEFPLNVMYWAERPDGGFEVLDGQQRTVSICQYVDNDFSFKDRFFHNLESDEKERIKNYKLMVYQCSGDDSEKLKWFETINIAGAALTKQEARNAVYSGSWVTDAKRYFSKTGCAAAGVGGDYLTGSAIRQVYLETAIQWHAGVSGDSIEIYMAKRKREDAEKAESLWEYFKLVIEWVEHVFGKEYKKEMKGHPWGEWYNKHSGNAHDIEQVKSDLGRLMGDKDVTRKRGVFEYILTGNESHLNIRAFDEDVRRTVYEQQKGICVKCEKTFKIEEMEADHITPWHKSGKTVEGNCQILCKPCNRKKGGK